MKKNDYCPNQTQVIVLVDSLDFQNWGVTTKGDLENSQENLKVLFSTVDNMFRSLYNPESEEILIIFSSTLVTSYNLLRKQIHILQVLLGQCA